MKQACFPRIRFGTIYGTHRFKGIIYLNLAGRLHISGLILEFTSSDLVMGSNFNRSLDCGCCRIGWAHLMEESIQLHWVCLSSVRSVSLLAGPHPFWLGLLHYIQIEVPFCFLVTTTLYVPHCIAVSCRMNLLHCQSLKPWSVYFGSLQRLQMHKSWGVRFRQK